MGMEVKNVSNKVLALGNNEFESGVINVSGGATIAKGTVLKRNADGKFAPAVSTDPTPGTHGVPRRRRRVGDRTGRSGSRRPSRSGNAV